MGKYKNKCFLTNNISNCVEHLEGLGYTKRGGTGIVWAIGITTNPEDGTYTLLGSNEVLKIFHGTKPDGLIMCSSFEDFKTLTSELDPDYVEPEQDETAEQPEPEVVAEAPKPKRTRKKKTEPETETTKSEEND